jgi:outer membrane receptor protein involved in Fe transport
MHRTEVIALQSSDIAFFFGGIWTLSGEHARPAVADDGPRDMQFVNGETTLHRPKLNAALLCAASIFTLTVGAHAQDAADVETVTVTGSRVISDSTMSPTPLTVVSSDQLMATTPSDIPTGLNKLPVFSGSHSPTTTDNASSNRTGNVLNLRNFGAQRTLVLFDGHRVTPSNADGTVDVDTLPQMLMSRVDVVTGGASAVYGSDAVTGVVNFVLDKTFTGFKTQGNAGISNFGDGASYQLGAAAGTSLFGGRGHIEGSVRHYHADTIHMNSRPWGRSDWVITGSGSAANPYVNTPNARHGVYPFTGLIKCAGTVANPCLANGQQFINNGVIGPYNPGVTTGTANVPMGGDGGYSTKSSLSAMVNNDEAFGRVSYDLDDTTNVYVQGIAAQAYNYFTFQNNFIPTGSVPNTFYKNNPFLPPDAQALLAGGTGNTFSISKFIDQPGTGFVTRSIDRNLSLTVGAQGKLLDRYDWDLFYTHGESRVKVDDPRNQNNQKAYAAQDAVLNSSGNPVCYVSTTANAGLYPGCVPMNLFGPSSLKPDQYNYFIEDTNFIISQVMDNVGGSVSGEVFELPAGPVKAAVSGEYRNLAYSVLSNAPPATVDCTGLRLCNSGTSLYQGNVSASQPESLGSVWEFAVEADVPLLKDLPLVQSLSANLAGRYTDYSNSGPVQTWKIGMDYHVNDTLRFRGTTSIDIRAPTLNDLFSPVQVTHGGFVDQHTVPVTASTVLTQTQGNPGLVPEVARTYTAGAVLTPSFLPGLSLSVDYYSITLKNVIGSISGGNSSIQQLCEASGGTSPYCGLYIRPLPFSDRTPANYPTTVLNQQLNTALNQTEGWDFEVNYGFELEDVLDGLPGHVNLRALVNDQPFNNVVAYPGAPTVRAVVPKARATTFIDYSVDEWAFHLQHRWLSGFDRSAQPGVIFYAEPRGRNVNYFDLNVERFFDFDDSSFSTYLSVQNLFDKKPPVQPNNTSTPGLYPGGIGSTNGNAYGLDVIGRYFTIGFRASL